MILNLSIKNFAIIEDININFKEGMNILLGETGAGKSIIIDAISLLMGSRSDFDKIRNGESKAIVEGTFLINNPETKKLINDKYSLIEDDDVLVVSRTLESAKSICRVNYRIVPQNALKEIMENIVDIHSQHKNNSFFDDKKQIDFLDLFIKKNGNQTFVQLQDEYNKLFSNYLKENNLLDEMIEKQKTFTDLDYLTFQIEEIEKLNLKENEIEEIENELIQLNSFEKIYTSYSNFQTNYQEASSFLYQAKKDLAHINNDLFEKETSRFEELYYELEDTVESMKTIFSNLENSKERIDYLTERKLSLAPLRRKYGRSSLEIINAYNDMKKDLDLIINFDDNIARQSKLIDKIRNELTTIGNEISSLRGEASYELEKLMNEQFKSLSLNDALFKVKIERNDLNIKGIDTINFLFRANLGSKFLSLGQSASLGETSRINLAYKLVFNKLNPVETIIFDEIDTGISSNVAVLVARKIRELSKNTQSIIISHLPQMVASADYALYVSKINENNITKTKIRNLNQNEVVEEISKMISGDQCNTNTYQAAKDLIFDMRK